jgi:hypothetical protein
MGIYLFGMVLFLLLSFAVKSTAGRVLLVIVFLLSIPCCYMTKELMDHREYQGNGDYHKDKDEGSEEPYIIARNIVGDKLQKYNDKDYPLLDYKAQDLGNDTWRIESYVDCEKGTSQEARIHYNIKMKHKGGERLLDRNWKVLEFTTE